MILNWIKCQGEVWCKLNSVNLDHPHFTSMEGVYIIWHGGKDAHTVRVGQGIIRDRLANHRLDSMIQQFSGLGLFVTWAAVPASDRNGVEAFLFQQLTPKVGDRKPLAAPIQVNLPWS